MQAQTLITSRMLCAVLAITLCHPGRVFSEEPDPLFQSDDLLSITLNGPFSTLNRERDKEKIYGDAQLIYTDQQDTEVSVDVQLQVRGNYRLRKEVCRVAPLRIHFDKPAKGTLFHKQKKLKLVTQCQAGSSRNAQYVLQEYLIYRMFNLVTDYSFKVRLTEVNYIDTRKKRTTTGYGFFIEDKKRVGKRLGLKPIDLNLVKVADLDPRQANLVSTFQFMIGNTDWSIRKGEKDEDCCHNAKLLGKEGSKYFPIPYDFDFSGFIDASYAEPSPNMPIRSVRNRYYRGFCEFNDLLDGTLERYQAARESIYSLIENLPMLTDRTSSKSRKYLERFYTLIGNPKAVKKKLIKGCR
jgi:hypothetical protein